MPEHSRNILTDKQLFCKLFLYYKKRYAIFYCWDVLLIVFAFYRLNKTAQQQIILYMDQKERILESAKRLMLLYGFKRFTIEDITVELGISKKTVYKLLKSKEKIIEECLEQTFLKERSRIDKIISDDIPFTEKLEQIIHVHKGLRLKPEYTEELRRYYPEAYKHLDDFFEYRKENYIALLKEAVVEKKVRADIDPAFFGFIFDILLKSIHTSDVLITTGLSTNEMMDQLKKLFLRGLVDCENI